MVPSCCVHVGYSILYPLVLPDIIEIYSAKSAVSRWIFAPSHEHQCLELIGGEAWKFPGAQGVCHSVKLDFRAGANPWNSSEPRRGIQMPKGEESSTDLDHEAIPQIILNISHCAPALFLFIEDYDVWIGIRCLHEVKLWAVVINIDFRLDSTDGDLIAVFVE